MDKEYVEKYVQIVSNIFRDKISKMKGIDLSKANGEALNPMIQRAALDYLAIRYHMFDIDEIKTMDEFDAENLNVDGNWYIGELQSTSEDLGIKMNISRFGAEDLSDLSIQLVGETERGEVIGIVETKDGTSGRISNEKGQIVQWREGRLAYRDGSTTIGYNHMPAEDLDSIIEMYRAGNFSRDLQTAAESPVLDSNHSLGALTSEKRDEELSTEQKQFGSLLKEEQENTHDDK